MHCLTNPEVQSWLAAATFADVNPMMSHLSGLESTRCGSLAKLPAEVSMATARDVDRWLWLSEPRTCLGLVFDTGVWASSENLSLYYCWRQALQVKSNLETAPGHLFLSFERDHFISLTQMAMIFGWGFFAFADSGRVAVVINHDGKVTAFADVPGRANELAVALAS